MKLVKQTRLTQAGRITKVYEVDLCEVGNNEYVVNFRYGKQGKALQDGSMTPLPVHRAEAERLFDQVVQQRQAKGYVDASGPSSPAAASSPAASTPAASVPTAPAASPSRSQGRARAAPLPPRSKTPAERAARRREIVVYRLRAGDSKYQEWPLNRALWRAGELGVTEAEPEILRHLAASRSDNLRRYCAVWALARCGSRAAVDPLVRLYEDTKTPSFLRRLCAEVLRILLSDAERQGLIDRERQRLPQALQTLAANGPAQAFEKALWDLFGTDRDTALDAYYVAYFIGNEHTLPAVLRFAREAPFEKHYFRELRALFKAAELRRDGQLYGILAHRFETTLAQHDQRAGRAIDKARPFSKRTRYYYRWRTWRLMRRLGHRQDPDFVRMAVGVLLPYTDRDGEYPERWWLFCHLLYQHSDRYTPESGRRFFRMSAARPTGQREEAFPKLWDEAPTALLHLLDGSKCLKVHEFAVRALRDNQTFLTKLDIDAIVMLLKRRYEVTAAFGFELAKEHYDPAKPSKKLLLALATSAHGPARVEGCRYIDQNRLTVTEDSAFLSQLVFCKHNDTRQFAKTLLRSSSLTQNVGQALVGRLTARLLKLGADADPRIDDVADTLLRALTMYIENLGADVIRDLVQHENLRIQELGGDLCLANRTLSRQVPSDLLMALLRGKNPAVRATGMRLLSGLAESDLSQRPELLFNLATSDHADLRNAVRPIIGRAAAVREELARELGELLLERLRFKAEKEIHSFVADVLRHELKDFLAKLPVAEVLRLLNSRFAYAQELGGELLQKNVPPTAMNVADIVKLCDHEIRAVREACWRLSEANVDRLKHTPDRAVKLLDAKWDDSRAWAFDFFRKHFDESVLTPTLLVSICDSIRPEVQQFGRELITRYFDPQYGPEYLLKLSEHPTEALQLFATNYLERFAAGDPERLRQLTPYFVGILSKVNKGRIAKIRTLRFLEAQALATPEAAAVLAPVLTRQSVTISVENKAALLEIMVKVGQKYPDVALPVSVNEPPRREVTRGV